MSYNCQSKSPKLNVESEEETIQEKTYVCVNFEIPLKNFIKSTNNQKTLRRIASVALWLYVRTDFESDDSENFIQIENSHMKSILLDLKTFTDGWNIVNITNIFRLPTFNLQDDLQTTKLVKFTIKCTKECSVGISNNELMITDENDFKSLIISNSIARKPLLSINVQEESLIDKNDEFFNSNSNLIRNKRKASHHNRNSMSYKANGIERENYTPKLCYNNYPDSNRECCLITYFVNFNSLKWSSWILSPSGFVANYCSGKCNELKSNS
jgi:hypothetical protein